MSHLRPIDPNNPDRVKPYDEYTAEERVHAITQIEDDHRNAKAAGKSLDNKTLSLAHSLSRGTDKQDNVDLPPAAAAGK